MRKLIKNLLEPKLGLVLAISYTIFLLVISLVKTQGMPKPAFDHVDKVFHACAYFGLTLVWYWYDFLRRRKNNFLKKKIWIIALLAILFGILIEVFQGVFTTYRSIEVLDALANTTGIFLAFLMLRIFRKPLEKVKSQL